jgi:hypothetical protein
MRSNRKSILTPIIAAILMIPTAFRSQALAGSNPSVATEWSVQVDKVDAGVVNIEPAFRIAIYENLLDELAKTKKFKEVLRDGNRNADGVPDLLVLKTTVEAYTPGSETRRAVTTVSGATRLKVRSQLCTRNGEVVFQREIAGDVHFFGSNLRATHNLARNVADAIKQSTLSEPTPSDHQEKKSEPAASSND